MKKQYVLTITDLIDESKTEPKKIKKDSHINDTIKKKNSQAFNNARIEFTVPTIIKHRVLDIKEQTGWTITEIMREALKNWLTSYEDNKTVMKSGLINKATSNECVLKPIGQIKC